jgi:hypothetical protein
VISQAALVICSLTRLRELANHITGGNGHGCDNWLLVICLWAKLPNQPKDNQSGEWPG